jgi:hypothetical protein
MSENACTSRQPGDEAALSGHVIVTGAAGFVGSHLVDALLAAGHIVTGIEALEHRGFRPDSNAAKRQTGEAAGKGSPCEIDVYWRGGWKSGGLDTNERTLEAFFAACSIKASVRKFDRMLAWWV